MLSTFAKRFFSTALSFLLLITAGPFEAISQQPAPPASGYSGQGAPLPANELQQLVAPIALYPDALVAQILGAATFPDQVAAASGWLQQNKNLTGTALMQAVDAQPWDPSVQALTQFPSVLDNLAKNLSWTSALGEAYHTQAADVMSAIQVLRGQAMAAGNLKSGPQITVVQQSPQVIVIQPTNPQVVYVPQYNPTVVYGTTYVTPGYSTADVVATGLLAFGVGIAVGAAISNNNCCGWGYSYWNCNWHGGAVVYRNNVYYGNRAWHGGYYGSTATLYGPNGAARVGSAYNPSTGTYARGATVATPYGTRSAGQAYNPSTGTYARGASASNAYGSQAVGQAYNPNTGAYGATHQASNAMGATEARSSQRTARRPTPNIKRPRKDRWELYKLRTAPKVLPRRVRTATLPRVKRQTATSTRPQTGMFTRTPGADGSKHRERPKSGTSYSGSSSAAAKGWGQQQSQCRRSSAFSGGAGGGWQSRGASARGSASRGGGGGWGGRK